MLIITIMEYETLRLFELENKFYKALVNKLDIRTGKSGKVEKVVEQHWENTLKEFDIGNNFLSVYEVFEVMA